MNDMKLKLKLIISNLKEESIFERNVIIESDGIDVIEDEDILDKN